MPTPAYISFPKGLPTLLVGKPALLRAVVSFYHMKSLRVCGVIKNLPQAAETIAANFGYSTRTLRKRVALLAEAGYVERPNRHDIVLRSSKFLATGEGAAKRYYKIPVGKLDQLELILKAYAAQENMQQQHHRVQQAALVNQRIDKAITNSSTCTCSFLRRQRKHVNVAERVEAFKSDFVSHVSSLANVGVRPGINPFATLSRQGIATVLNRRSKATGQRYANLFKQAGLLTDTPNRVFVCRATKQEYHILQQEVFGYDFTYQRNRFGEVEKVLANTLSFQLAE